METIQKAATGEMIDLRQQDDASFMAEVAPALDELEEIRKIKLKSYDWRLKVGMVAGGILTPICGWADWLLLTIQRGSDDSAAGLTVAMLGALYWWVTQPKRDYAKAYKVEVMPRIAKLLGNLRYIVDGKILMAEMILSKIVPDHHRYTSEDYFEGVYKGVQVKLSEINFEVRRRSNKRTYYVSVFKGLAILIAHPRPKFLGHTILRRDSSKVSKWFMEKGSKLEHANLVDPEFEKMFDVFTSDQVEARYLIDPAMIETLKELAAAFESGIVMAAYYGAKTLILIPSKKNHFEPQGIRIAATDPGSVQNMKHDLEQVLNLIDRLEMYEIGNRRAAAISQSSAAG
jgi:hypothetical protein